ncbi:hypothetical protein [Limnoglobus roseus]|uniref:Uncharacterized protein n=1 Tax=Limnoglobus roseus TaxID=2598579 RepID=A0A5C1A6F8_9BACT|nr:hypothetical protein [Limnoglobus roseus]QEL13576.1 hypothetical protein PX52LOC_00434 [Limnoglobus roseus]
MYRIAAGGLAAVVCLAAGVAFGDGPKATDSRPAAKKADDKSATPQRPSVIIAPLTADVLAEAVKEEQKACTRRLDACAKLREIAVAKNNDALLQQIDEFERQAVEICQARVARMGVRGNATRSAPKAAAEPAFDAAKVAAPTPADAAGGK